MLSRLAARATMRLRVASPFFIECLRHKETDRSPILSAAVETAQGPSAWIRARSIVIAPPDERHRGCGVGCAAPESITASRPSARRPGQHGPNLYAHQRER